MHERSEEILSYWFGDDAVNLTDGEIVAAGSPRWFGRDDDVDAEIRARFAGLLAAAARGELDHWSDAPRERLALVILLDQFSRNIHRDAPEAFANDRLALTHSLAGQTHGQDRSLRPAERLFFYMPMMHAEALMVQDEAVQRFQALAESVPAAERPAFETSLEAARQHRDIILRFDRFPHRNHALGRQSTPAETAFLAQPESSF